MIERHALFHPASRGRSRRVGISRGIYLKSWRFIKTLAQTPGPDLVFQDTVMESQEFISSENSCISASRRTRAGLTFIRLRRINVEILVYEDI